MKKIVDCILSKRILYIVCFLAINLIEFCKATQNGDVWYVAVNLTGLVVFVMIASTYQKKDVVNWFNAIYSVLCVLVMATVYWVKQSYPEHYFHLGQVESALVNVWWIGIAAHVLWRRIFVEHTRKTHLSKLAVLWIAMMVCMIFSVSGKVWPLWFLVMFGIFYLTDFSDGDKRLLLDGMLDGTILSFFGFQIFAYATRPYDEVRYVGFYANCNVVALYYLIIYGMVLCKLHILHMRKKAIGWKLFYFIGAGGLLSFQIFTLCRTAWLASVVVTVVYGVCVVHKIWKEKWRMVLLRGVALSLMAAATFLPVFYTIRWLPTLTHYRVWFEGEYSIDKVHSFDPADSEKYIELDEFLEQFIGRIVNTLKSANAANPLVLKANAQEIEQVDVLEVPWTQDESTRIRLTIYKTYLQGMTWYGNPPDKGFYRIGTGQYSWHAQNLWIQIGYTFGIPAGILCILLTIVLLWNDFKRMMKNKENVYAILPVFVSIIFFMFGLLEVVWLPGQLILFLMFFLQHPQLCNSQEKIEG